MTPTQLKAKVKNISRENEVDPQLVLRHFMMEKFLEKSFPFHQVWACLLKSQDF